MMLKKCSLDDAFTDEFYDAFHSRELDEELRKLDELSRFGQKPHYITVTQSMSQLKEGKRAAKRERLVKLNKSLNNIDKELKQGK